MSDEIDPITEVIAAVLAPFVGFSTPSPCDEPGCENRDADGECHWACDVCGMHDPYCNCV